MLNWMKAFRQGQVLGIQGESPSRDQRVIEALRSMGVTRRSILVLDIQQWLDLESQDQLPWMLTQVKVVLLKSADQVSRANLTKFSHSLIWFTSVDRARRAQFVFTFSKKDSDGVRALSTLNPILSRMDSESNPGALNECVHRYLEIACLLEQKQIFRLTEKAAHFLEKLFKQKQTGAEVLDFLRKAVRQSSSGCLRYADFQRSPSADQQLEINGFLS